MRIIVNGQQAFGQAVLEKLLERGEEVVAVYCGPDKEGRKMDPLKEFALSKDLPVHQPASFKTPDVAEQVRSLNPDLGVMAYVTLFVPEEVLNIPKLGTIQYHPSLLPDHKGPSSINWPIIFGKKKTGLSIFWPDNGLDTGPILMQKEVDISDTDTLGSLYFKQLFPLGVEAMIESVDLVREGKAPKVAQNPDAGTYEGWCRKADAEIDWSKPVEEVYNLIRGTNPAPGAWITVNGSAVQIFDAVRLDQGAGNPGEVTAISDDGVDVAANGGSIRIIKVRPEKEVKMDAAEYASNIALAVGSQLG